MTAPGRAALRQLALTVLARRAGPTAGAEAIAAATDRAYDDLARVLATVIGDTGVNALTNRTLHLAKGEYSWLVPTRAPEDAEDTFAQIIDALKRQDPAVATEAAAACSGISN
jgi:DNA-binding GntR family transcriptional regulator